MTKPRVLLAVTSACTKGSAMIVTKLRHLCQEHAEHIELHMQLNCFTGELAQLWDPLEDWNSTSLRLCHRFSVSSHRGMKGLFWKRELPPSLPPRAALVAVFVRSEYSDALVGDGVLQPAPRSANLDSAFGGMQLFATEAWRAAPLLLTHSAQLTQPTVRLPQL